MLQIHHIRLCVLLAKNFKKKKKHKAKNYPAQHKLKELAATNNPVEEEETTMTNSKWSTFCTRYPIKYVQSFLCFVLVIQSVLRWFLLSKYPHSYGLLHYHWGYPFSTLPRPEPIMGYCQLYHWEQTSEMSHQNTKDSCNKMRLKMFLHNIVNFVLAPKCYKLQQAFYVAMSSPWCHILLQKLNS